MIGIAQDFLDALGRPAVYRAVPDAEPVPTVVIFKEGSSEVRFGRAQLIAYQAEATIPATLSPIRFARLEIAGSVYSIEQKILSTIPGLIDCGLKRLSGAHVTADPFGAAADAIAALGREVTIDGQTVMAQGFPRGVAEENEFGQVVEKVRLVLSVAAADVAGVQYGAPAVVDGASYKVDSVLPDARGLARVVMQ